MSKRFEFSYDEYENTRYIYDCETELDYEEWDLKLIADILNEQDQQIKSLESRLANCIEPKFRIGQECYVLLGKEIEKITIVGCRIKISKMEDENFTMYSITDIQGYACSVMEEQVFATKEEAQAKLQELKGEKQ